MSNIFYTSTGSFWYGFDVYYGMEVDRVLPINPQDPSTYSYTYTVNYQDKRSFTLTEDQEGWCTDCVFVFAIRSWKETTWAITAQLDYSER